MTPAPTRVTSIVFSGRPLRLACDERCDKAWGINHRPRLPLADDDDDDYAFLADGELGTAPADRGTYEGGHGKPEHPSERHNKWCARECERSELVAPHETIVLPDFSRRVLNCPHKHPEDLERLTAPALPPVSPPSSA